MRPTLLLLSALAALGLLLSSPVAPAAPPAGKGKKERECDPNKPREKKRTPKGGCAPVEEDDEDFEWEQKWRIIGIELDGTTTARYEEDDKRYTIDGTMRYRTGDGPAGFMDLRRKKAVAPGLWSVTSGPVVVTTSSKARYADDNKTVDCSWTPPRSIMPKALAGVASIKHVDELSVQWSIAPTAQKCTEPVDPFWNTELPTEAMTSTHRRGDHYGATKVLHVEIDETIRERVGYMRVTWKGKITLRKAKAVG